MRLTEPSDWSKINAAVTPAAPNVFAAPSRPTESWGEEHFWKILLPRFVVKPSAVLEMGAAPGLQVLRFAHAFHCQPYGLEYTDSGVEAIRKNFATFGYPDDQVLKGDIFDQGIQQKYAGRFDVVFSRGLIEHFDDPRPAVAAHIPFSKPGGIVIITIPTLTGVHYASTKLFSPEKIPLHNLQIMGKPQFKALFDQPDLEPLFCDYAGGPNLLIGVGHEVNGAKAIARRALGYTQALANVAQRVTGDLPAFWPLHANLVYIGRVRGS